MKLMNTFLFSGWHIQHSASFSVATQYFLPFPKGTMVLHVILSKLPEFSVQNVFLCFIACYYSKIQPHSLDFFTAFSSFCRKDYFSPMRSPTNSYTDFTNHLRYAETTSRLLCFFSWNASSLRASIVIYLPVFPHLIHSPVENTLHMKNTTLSPVSFLWLLWHPLITHFQVCDLDQLFKFQKSQFHFLCRGDIIST